MLFVACRSGSKSDSSSGLDTEWTASPWQQELHKSCLHGSDTLVSALILAAITHEGMDTAGLGRI